MPDYKIHKQIPLMIQAVKDELEKIRISKKTITLFEGKLKAQKDADYIYKFELPEGTAIGNIEECDIIIGNEVIKGEILSIDSQFVILKLSVNLGDFISELTIEWSSDIILRKLNERLHTLNNTPNDFNLELTDLLFYPNKTKVKREYKGSSIDIDNKINPTQENAIKGALSNKVSFIWGPPGTGKTYTLGFIAYNLIKNGKKILFATNTNRAVDVAIIQIIEVYKQLGREQDFIEDITRYGCPFILDNKDLDSVFFENQIEEIRNELREKIKEELHVWQDYYELKVKMSLHQEYIDEFEKVKQRITTLEKSLNVILIELKELKNKIDKFNNVGILESIARIFVGDSLETLKEKFNNKKQKGILIKNELSNTNLEYEKLKEKSPIEKNEIEKFNELKKKVDDFGGESKLQKFIEESLAIDETSILRRKKFIGATLAKMITNDLFFELV